MQMSHSSRPAPLFLTQLLLSGFCPFFSSTGELNDSAGSYVPYHFWDYNTGTNKVTLYHRT